MENFLSETRFLERLTILENSLKLLRLERESNMEITEQRVSKLTSEMRFVENSLKVIMKLQELTK